MRGNVKTSEKKCSAQMVKNLQEHQRMTTSATEKTAILLFSNRTSSVMVVMMVKVQFSGKDRNEKEEKQQKGHDRMDRFTASAVSFSAQTSLVY